MAIPPTSLEKNAAKPSLSTSSYKILMAANDIYRDNPVLPIPLGDIAKRAGFSRSLIYTHFPEQTALIHGLITHHITSLSEKFNQAVNAPDPFIDVAITLGEQLFQHYIQHGLLLALVPQDVFIRPNFPDDYVRLSKKNIHTLARKLTAEFSYSPRHAIALLILLSVIPEQTARLVYAKQLSLEAGRRAVRSAITISVQTFPIDNFE